jgi:hypothetical protein
LDTSFLGLPFSSSSCVSRFISVSRGLSFFFHLKQAAWLIPARRQISATGIASAPASE